MRIAFIPFVLAFLLVAAPARAQEKLETLEIAGKSGVMSDLEPGAVVFGTPAQPKAQAFRQLAWLKRMSSGPKRPPQ